MLSGLKIPPDPRLLVGINTADDAGVFLVEEGLALVQTVDLLTPMVEDPYTFGRIAAANSLSDVYAMGGVPLTALNIAGFPAPADKRWLTEILRGGQDAVLEAGAVVAGGHTFNEPEIKYGLAVTGRIQPDRIVTNAGAKPGQALVLTKPLGTGVFGQMMMQWDEPDHELYEAATRSMTQLNRAGAEAMLAVGASAATDITGYGLLGHAQEMAEASGVIIRFFASALPFLPRVRELAEQGLRDAGVAMNESAFGASVSWAGDVPEPVRGLLWGSESSGGLLVAVASEQVQDFQRRAQDAGIVAPVVGEVKAGKPGRIEVRR